MKNHKIEFKFIENRFNYDLPLIDVDLEFLQERRVEIVSCIGQLSSRIGEINLASRNSVSEMDKSHKLLAWYHAALHTINAKTYMINNPGAYDKKAMTETEAALWIAASSRID